MIGVKYTALWSLIATIFLSCSKSDVPDPNIPPGVKSNEKSIVSDPVIMGINDVQVAFDKASRIIELTVPAATDISALRLDVKISAKAKISPNPSQSRDYTRPVNYTVTAEDGSQQVYELRVVKQSSASKMCVVSRIEDGDDYYNFRYDGTGRVTEIETRDESTLNKTVKVVFKYNATGDLVSAEIPVPEELGGGTTQYKPIYENGKFVRLAVRSFNGNESSSTVKLDGQSRFIGFKGDRCNLYVSGAVTEVVNCSTGFLHIGMQYKEAVWHFMESQSGYPAFMSVYTHFFGVENADILSQLGRYLPTERIFYRFPGSRIYERSKMTYKTNEYGFPVEIRVTTEKKLDTDFPYTNTNNYKLTYINCP